MSLDGTYEKENGKYTLEIFMVFQRKVFFSPHIIDNVTEKGVEIEKSLFKRIGIRVKDRRTDLKKWSRY